MTTNLLKEKIDIYFNQILKVGETFNKTIQEILTILMNNNTVFITGIGKSYHLSKKCVATWQSLGINAHTLLPQDLFHGDLGIIKDNDVIIYISNSGNTEELIHVSKYIKDNLNVTQIALTNNLECKFNDTTDYVFNICDFKIQEADKYNIVPSVSSVIFLMFLDLLGITISERNNFTINDFKKNHPSGLGKMI